VNESSKKCIRVTFNDIDCKIPRIK
jgi:hypothetical protein